jgi:hypothetical protein
MQINWSEVWKGVLVNLPQTIAILLAAYFAYRIGRKQNEINAERKEVDDVIELFAYYCYHVDELVSTQSSEKKKGTDTASLSMGLFSRLESSVRLVNIGTRNIQMGQYTYVEFFGKSRSETKIFELNGLLRPSLKLLEADFNHYWIKLPNDKGITRVSIEVKFSAEKYGSIINKVMNVECTRDENFWQVSSFPSKQI